MALGDKSRDVDVYKVVEIEENVIENSTELKISYISIEIVILCIPE
jgi:hypothetical protein